MPISLFQSKKKFIVLLLFVVLLVGILMTLQYRALRNQRIKTFSYVVGINQETKTEYHLRDGNGNDQTLFTLLLNQKPSAIVQGRMVAFEEKADELLFFLWDLNQRPASRKLLFQIPEKSNNIKQESIALLPDARVIVSITEQTEESVVPWRMYMYIPTGGVQRIQSALLPQFSERRLLGIEDNRAFFLQKSTEACITDIGIIDLQSGEETWIAKSIPEQPLCVVPSGLSVDRQWILFDNRTVTSQMIPMGWSVFHMSRQEFLPTHTAVSGSVGKNSAVWDGDTNEVATWIPNEQNAEGITRGRLFIFDPETRETTEQQLTIPASEANLLWKKGAMMLYKGVVRTDSADASGLSHVLISMNSRYSKELLRSQHTLIFIGVVE